MSIERFHVSVPQEDRIVQRDSQLQHCGDSHRDEGYLSLEIIAPHVVQYRHSYAQQEQERRCKGVEQYHHCDKRYNDRYSNIFYFFSLAQILEVENERTHSGYICILLNYASHLVYSFKSLCGRQRRIEENYQHRRVRIVEVAAHCIRQDIKRDGRIENIHEVDDTVDMVHITDPVSHLSYIILLHVLDDDHRESAFAEFVHQQLLTLHGLKVIRQIIQHIVVDPCLN